MRTNKTLREIERLLADAVRAVAGCEKFKGVVVEIAPPGAARRNGANWLPGFVDYGSANSMLCNEALARAVQELQMQFDAVA